MFLEACLYNRFATLLGQFNLQKFMSSFKENGSTLPSESSWLKSIGRQLRNKSFYALNLCSEVLITPDDTLLLSIEGYGDEEKARHKAVIRHKARIPEHLSYNIYGALDVQLVMGLEFDLLMYSLLMWNKVRVLCGNVEKSKRKCFSFSIFSQFFFWDFLLFFLA